ncbi:Zinc finger, RING/FYVE/PHD-type [Cynara cardunculus var. scolymus]|uniref:Zinc finger, RING/FYVE/PHD-type n=2 Tax=Cynara cardunculus var. scolymus TaxID=59895 RepID=A0A103Y9W5_CYNCS|nr:Zinc finger, RING/FYVE/PHD-type [Cynara cardunculus var. scolymus]
MMKKLGLFSFSSLKSGYDDYGGSIRHLFSSILSQLFFQALLLIFIFHFGVVGGTIGAVAGALIGFKHKMSFLQDVMMGAASGVALSQKLITAIFDYLRSDDHDQHLCFLHLIDIVAADVESKLLRDQDHIFLVSKVESCEKLVKLPKIEISKHDVFDSSGNATCCSICLQDFEVGNSAGIFPKCDHKFHPECISQWLRTHNSCPVCRRSL